MKKIFYLYIFTHSFFPYNLDGIPLIGVPPVQLYMGDILTLYVILAAGKALLTWKSSLCQSAVTPYLMLLAWILVAIVSGIGSYGFRTFGESRTVIHFFTFAIPYALFTPEEAKDKKRIAEFVLQTVFLSGFCAGAMFFLGPFFETGQMDFRGARILTSNQTFFLILMSLGLFLGSLKGVVLKAKQSFLGIAFLLLGILSKNRTALISLSLVFAIYVLVTGHAKTLVFALLVLVALGGLLVYVMPEETSEITAALEGLLDPLGDPNYSWRLMVQGAVVEQALETFWTGQGYGGYFSYIVEEDGNFRLEEVTPHNQYITLFLKTGMIGVVLCVFSIGWILHKGRSALKKYYAATSERVVLILLLLAAASQLIYGLGYDFQALFGLYLGFAGILIQDTGTLAANRVDIL